MKGCGAKTQHIVVNAAAPGSGTTMLPSSAAILAKLNVLAPTVFPLRQPGTPPGAVTCPCVVALPPEPPSACQGHLHFVPVKTQTSLMC